MPLAACAALPGAARSAFWDARGAAPALRCSLRSWLTAPDARDDGDEPQVQQETDADDEPLPAADRIRADRPHPRVEHRSPRQHDEPERGNDPAVVRVSQVAPEN